MPNIKSLARETLIYGLSYSLGRLINFLLVTIYLTRVFSQDAAYFSIYNELYFFIALFLGLLTLRMETSLFRFASDENYKSSIYPIASQMVFLVTFLFILLVYFFIEPIEIALKYPSMRTAIYYAAWIVVLDVIASLPFSSLRFKNKAMRYALIKGGGLLINVILVIVLLMYYQGDAIRNLSMVLLANLISSIIVCIVLIPEIRQSFVRADWSITGKILNYAFPLILVSAAFVIIQYGGTSILKYFLPGTTMQNLEESSQYNAALRLSVIMNLFVTAFNYAAEPFFFRHIKREDSKHLFARASLYFVIACCFIFMIVCLYKDLIALLLDKNFRDGMHLLKILLLANIFTGLYVNFSSWYKMSDKNYVMAVISLSGLVLMLLVNILLIPQFGTSAAAYANLVAYFFICALSYYIGQKSFQIPYHLLKMCIYLLISIIVVWMVPMIYNYVGLVLWMQYLISFFMLAVYSLYVYYFELQD